MQFACQILFGIRFALKNRCKSICRKDLRRKMRQRALNAKSICHNDLQTIGLAWLGLAWLGLLYHQIDVTPGVGFYLQIVKYLIFSEKLGVVHSQHDPFSVKYHPNCPRKPLCDPTSFYKPPISQFPKALASPSTMNTIATAHQTHSIPVIAGSRPSSPLLPLSSGLSFINPPYLIFI